MIPIIDFETFAASRGAGFGDLGDAGTHSPTGNLSRAAKRRLAASLAAKSAAWQLARDAARIEYEQGVRQGLFRPATGLEELEATAKGHPDNASTQAALRVLEKRKARKC